MAVFKVEGGHRLSGSITPQGAKNEALQIICATLLTAERVTVYNVPQILDVMQLIELLRHMGVEAATKSAAAGSTPTSSGFRNWAPSSISMRRKNSSRSKDAI